MEAVDPTHVPCSVCGCNVCCMGSPECYCFIKCAPCAQCGREVRESCSVRLPFPYSGGAPWFCSCLIEEMSQVRYENFLRDELMHFRPVQLSLFGGPTEEDFIKFMKHVWPMLSIARGDHEEMRDKFDMFYDPTGDMKNVVLACKELIDSDTSSLKPALRR